MTAITFDTLAYSKKLKKAGIPERQAEAQTEITAEMMTEIFENQVATKHDLQVLKAAMKHDLLTLQANLTLRMGIMIAGGVTLVPLILKIVNLIH